ncbi:MAG: hypothetical protein MAG715_01128 [Methanonatronarchaeales archaeon]|nr:hypothetical protein [Methanonatronarchaeales archaeon]
MAQKTIGIREGVYQRLRALKGEDESFSDLIDRLVEGDKPADELLKFRGAWRSHGVDAESLKEELRRDRQRFEARV